jgi:hypothetical protein
MEKKDGAMDASAVPLCNARTSSACLGARGTHRIAKNARTGTCPAMSSCHKWGTGRPVGLMHNKAAGHNITKDISQDKPSRRATLLLE